MDVKTYRAATMQEALTLVRRDLGPTAAVLHTREVRGAGLLGWIPGWRRIEITASAQVNVPSRMPAQERDEKPRPATRNAVATAPAGVAPPRVASVTVREEAQTLAAVESRSQFRDDVKGKLSELQSMVEDLCRRTRNPQHQELPESLFRLYTDLIDAEVNEDLARQLVDKVRHDPSADLSDALMLKTHIARMVEDEIHVSGPIRPATDRCHLVALVGPTGVGKTTTIAKLAANFRLRDKRRVGLITVDTYRIAAVEQLRTYADIIDLPMKVVSTPREMRQAVNEMSDLDLVLLDTAGRSPKDEVKLQELRAFLTEAEADEVHLVMSSVASSSVLVRTAEQFASVGTTALVLTKLDEATGLGNLLPLLRTSKLPLSYLTNGQNVPDDILPADRRRVARMVLGMEAGLPE
jgi:flagellar biosynthesis protein FlhF